MSALFPILNLPPDAIDVLAQYLEAQDLVALLSTGCKALSVLIEQRASVSRISVNFTRPVPIWPAVFKRQRGLRFLRAQISSTSLAAQTAMPSTLDILLLPPTLTRIHLGAPSAESLFVADDRKTFAISFESVFPLLQHLTLLGRPVWHDALLLQLPRSLRTLELPLNDKITPVGVANLPRELETLSLPKAASVYSPEGLAALPGHLTSLSLWLFNRVVPSLPIVVPHLTHLEVHGNYPAHEQLAQVLADLPIKVSSIVIYCHAQLDSIDLNAAANLVELRVRCSHLPSLMWLTKLPPSLTVLEVGNGFLVNSTTYYMPERYPCPRNVPSMVAGHTMTGGLPQVFNALPRTLTHLDISYYCFFRPEQLADLPPTLTFLHLPVRHKSPPVALGLKWAPRTLRTLWLPYTTIDATDLLDCPPQLADLLVYEVKISESILPMLKQQWKDSDIPRSLSLQTCVDCASSFLPKTFHIWIKLPWVMRITTSILQGDEILPTNVTEVDLDSIDPGVQPRLATLPSHLKSLILNKSTAFFPYEYAITTSFMDEPDEQETTPSWPAAPDLVLPMLTKLSLQSDTSMLSVHVPLLPPTLTHLVLTFNDSLTDDAIAFLPPQLVYLDLSYNTRLTNACVPNLPQSLTYLNMWSNPHLTDASIVSLPRGLKELYLACAKVTNAGLVYLPPSLEVLDLGDGSAYDKVAVEALPKTLRLIRWQWTRALATACTLHLPDFALTQHQKDKLGTDVDPKTAQFWRTHRVYN